MKNICADLNALIVVNDIWTVCECFVVNDIGAVFYALVHRFRDSFVLILFSSPCRLS